MALQVIVRYAQSIHPNRAIRPLALAALCWAHFARAGPWPPAAGVPGSTARQLSTAAASIREALAAPPADPPPGAIVREIRLIDATLSGGRLTLNFSREVLDLGPGSLVFEAWMHRINHAASDALIADLTTFEIYTTIEDVPLHLLINAAGPASGVAPPRAPQIAPSGATPVPASQALAGRRIAISPGHGYYLNDASRWVLQRDFYFGIVEDFVNHDIVTYLNQLLLDVGADARPTRNLDRNAGIGESGFPKWQEAARYHLKAIGADPSVWNGSGSTQLAQDINSRPRYANAINADLLVSIHNNGGLGTGTETWYETNNAYAAESKRLADIVHEKVISAIRRDYNPTWTDRRVKGANGTYGENSVATRPAIIVEIAFMDQRTPDNAALQDERFKQLVAAAIRDGIRDYVDGPAPAAPSTLVATGDATGVSLSWIDAATSETGFQIERKTGPSGTWAALATVAANTTSYRDASASAGLTYLYRIQAFNAGGNPSQSSNEATAAIATPPVTLVLASVTPTTVQVRDWNQDVAFTLTVADGAGRPVIGASVVVQDGMRNTTSTLAATTADATGQLTFRSTVPVGQASANYSFVFQATKSDALPSASVTRQAQVSHLETSPSAAGSPTISAQPAAQSVTAGGNASFGVTASGTAPLAYQWRSNATDLPGATNASLAIPGVTAAQAGNYSVTVTSRAGSVTSLVAPLTVAPAAWLSNISVRTTLTSGQNVIVGFVVDGGTKDVLVRAAGPALAAFGLATAMADPRLELYRGSAKITENNDWPAALAPTIAALGAFPFSAASRDAALLQSLSGPHTVQAMGTGGGVVLIEGYDAGSGSATRIVNLSARNRVGTGADILIAGFFIAGSGTQRVLIRAVGPTLAALGVTGALADPQLVVNDASGRVAANDNWDASLAPVFAQVGAFALPGGSRDSAIVATLNAGRSYTVQVSGLNGGVGEALIEVYEVP
ncbi:MAG: hypothetical protein EXS37_04855 [Opitutus sp.]|nr:hypothetical protein [Opitutus sp.]